jgi:hypothetical protein
VPQRTDDYLSLDDAALLRACDVHVYRSSGPGGQHRNKVSTAVRLRHVATGIDAHGDESRSQAENKAAALRRLRMKIACHVRRPMGAARADVPAVVAECMFVPRGPAAVAPRRLKVGRKDFRFWRVAAFLLDVIETFQGRLSDAAAYVGISTGNLVSLLKEDRHLLAAAQGIRKSHGHPPLT